MRDAPSENHEGIGQMEEGGNNNVKIETDIDGNLIVTDEMVDKFRSVYPGHYDHVKKEDVKAMKKGDNFVIGVKGQNNQWAYGIGKSYNLAWTQLIDKDDPGAER